MRAVLKTITPETAKKWLEDTDFQRPLNTAFVDQLCRQIVDGKFVCNGETIVIDTKCRVLDGQHRLWACFMAEKSIQAWVIEGADPSLFPTYDTGRARDAYDVISIAERGTDGLTITSRRAMAIAIKLLMQFEDGRYVASRYSNRKPSNAGVVQWAKDHPEIVEEAITIVGMGRWPIAASIALAIFHLVKPGFPDSLDMFFRPLQAGTGLTKSSPILMLREFFAARRGSIKVHPREVLAMTIKAWNSWALADGMRSLRFASGTEAFPTLVLRPGVRPKNVKKGGSLSGVAKTKYDLRVARESNNGSLQTAGAGRR